MGFFPAWNAELQTGVIISGARTTSMAHLVPKAELSIPGGDPSDHPQTPIQEAFMFEQLTITVQN